MGAVDGVRQAAGSAGLYAVPVQLPRVLSLMPSSFVTIATGRDVSVTIFTASSLKSGENLLLFGRVKLISFRTSS
jgi:hypothetical protein